ncbi:unnamed protein product [Camellia sinensis]
MLRVLWEHQKPVMGHGHGNGLDVPPKYSEAQKHDIQNRSGMLKFVASMKDLDGHVAQIRGKSEEKLASYEMADERDINAAHVLVELANCVSGLPKNCLQSFRRSSSVFQIPENKLLTTVLADGNSKDANRLGGDGKTKKPTGVKLQFSLSKANDVERKQKKRTVENNFSLPHSKNQFITEEEEDSMHGRCGLSDGCRLTSRSGKKGWQKIEAFVSDDHDGLGMASLESKKAAKKQKTKTDETYLEGCYEYDLLCSRSKQFIDKPIPVKKRSGLQKVDVQTVCLVRAVSGDMLLSADGSVDAEVSVVKPAKRKQFPLITPTIHTGFSFSIIHLLSAVRMTLATPHDCKDIPNENPVFVNGFHSCENEGVVNSEQAEERNIPSLTIHEIVWRLRLKPGDPCILETEETLPDLVRGVLKIFSSRTAPLGADSWKPLTTYAKPSKTWSWVGPLCFNSSSDDCTSSEAWGLPHKMLVKLVDCFANWLKNDQESLKQISSLPAPPVALLQPIDGKERFKGLRAQKSLSTISPSSDEVRTYFHREEILRYSIPERAFSYTALDGKKSTVAPLRKCSGKPSARVRDHFMLKNNRPPHVTVLCLVRDATARLPGSMGTRADVCTLIRDSQFVVDEISDSQLNQVVSGALDRLHYELDPCVKYDRDRHLWVYLHGEREEEEFESDGTSSRRRCKWLDSNLA